jgi:plasmid replication initiation protein
LGEKVCRGGSQNNFAGELRRVFGLESVKDAEGNIIKEAPLPIWANFLQRALDVAVKEINAKTDLKIKLASTERSKQRRVVGLNFTIKTRPIPKGATRLK